MPMVMMAERIRAKSSELVANSRARSDLPAPRLVATSAAAAIPMPMLTDRLVKTMVPAYPMAAVTSVWFRRLRKNRSARSTMNMAIRPKAPVSVMTTTWFMVEPVTNRAGVKARIRD